MPYVDLLKELSYSLVPRCRVQANVMGSPDNLAAQIPFPHPNPPVFKYIVKGLAVRIRLMQFKQ